MRILILLALLALGACEDGYHSIDVVDPRTGCHWVIRNYGGPGSYGAERQMDSNGEPACDRPQRKEKHS